MNHSLVVIKLIAPLILVMMNTVQAGTQSVFPSNQSFKVEHNDIVEFDVLHSTTNPDQTTGLGIKLYFDSSKLELVGFSDVLDKDKIAEAITLDSRNEDLDDNTDKVFTIAWANFGSSWPNSSETNTNLFKANFRVTQELSSTSKINLLGDASAENVLVTQTANVQLKEVLSNDYLTNNIISNNEVTQQTDTNQNLNSTGGGLFFLLLFPLFCMTLIKSGVKK